MTTPRTMVLEADARTRWNKGIAVAVGILFFFQLITFLIGSSLIETYLAGDSDRVSLTMGVLLEMVAGIAVVAIGFLMYRVLKTVDKRIRRAHRDGQSRLNWQGRRFVDGDAGEEEDGRAMWVLRSLVTA